jgi:hypothetical protein
MNETETQGQGPVRVPREVYDGLEAVRSSGETNMFDRPRVAQLALQAHYPEAAEWVYINREEYAQGVFRGFEPVS